MRLHFCGVRGSTQAVGEAFARYGGHTSCVALAHDGDPPSLLLDAGTGLRNVTPLLRGAPFRGAILLGHLHWDHTHGLPFFSAADRPDSEVAVYLPAQGNGEGDGEENGEENGEGNGERDGDAEAVLARGFSPPHFPITPRELRGAWTFAGIEEGTHHLAGFDVLAREIPHKGGRTFGYRISDGQVSIAYLSDHHPATLGSGPDGVGPYHAAARELADGVDLLVHDAQYLPHEWPTRGTFGHATPGYAVGLAAASGAARVALFHHDPARTDAEIDAVLAACRTSGGPVVSAAAEGDVVCLSPAIAGG